MLPWINEHLAETKERLHEWRLSRNINVLATVDHVEQASTHIILGLNVAWENKTPDLITIIELQVMLYRRNESELLLRLLPLERFSRPDVQKRAFQKDPLSQIELPPREIHSEHIRFLSHGHFDLPPGIYTMDVQVTDEDHNKYSRRTKVEVINKMKYRLDEDWRQVMEEA